MSLSTLHQALQQAEDALETAQSKLLRRAGWVNRCDLPGALWLWQKAMPDGRVVACPADIAIRIQEHVGDAT